MLEFGCGLRADLLFDHHPFTDSLFFFFFVEFVFVLEAVIGEVYH